MDDTPEPPLQWSDGGPNLAEIFEAIGLLPPPEPDDNRPSWVSWPPDTRLNG